jgi:REP element-mobilizing transposase RayT
MGTACRARGRKQMIVNDLEKPQRRSVRMGGYDYSSCGAYFVTVCADRRMNIFGSIEDGKMVLNEAGRIAEENWLAIPQHFPSVSLYEHVVMPNHFHGVLFIDDCRGTACRAHERSFGKPDSTSLSTIVRSYKSSVTKRINEFHQTHGVPVWQRGFYEHIIRNEEEMYGIQTYIQNNPMQWELDEENPDKRDNTRTGTACRAPTTRGDS